MAAARGLLTCIRMDGTSLKEPKHFRRKGPRRAKISALFGAAPTLARVGRRGAPTRPAVASAGYPQAGPLGASAWEWRCMWATAGPAPYPSQRRRRADVAVAIKRPTKPSSPPPLFALKSLIPMPTLRIAGPHGSLPRPGTVSIAVGCWQCAVCWASWTRRCRRPRVPRTSRQGVGSKGRCR